MDLLNFDTEKRFDYENAFSITSDPSRIGKIISHYKLYEMISNIPGDIIETGVFKGASLIRWLTYRNLLENEYSRTIIGFDSFDSFPDTTFDDDKKYRENFINDAGDKSITKKELEKVLQYKNLNNYELIQGDIVQTLPKYFKNNPHKKIAMLHIDCDIYEPAKISLEIIWSRLVKGGIIILDDYGTFPGETKAVDDFFKNKDININKLSISAKTPSYIIKNSF